MFIFKWIGIGKDTTLKIYNKKHTLGREIKAAANPQRVSARVLVIKTIEKILVSESEKSTSPDDKQTIDQVLENIKKRKSHCEHHDIKIPDLIDDLKKMIPIWEKSRTNNQPIPISSPAALRPSKKIDPPKESPAEKIASIKITKKSTKYVVKSFVPNLLKKLALKLKKTYTIGFFITAPTKTRKKILVTGSNGLIGSEVTKFYLNLGYDVIGIDNNMREYFFGISNTIHNFINDEKYQDFKS